MALQICEKRLLANSEIIFSLKEWQSDIDCISEDIHFAFCDLKAPSNFSAMPLFRKVQKVYKEKSEE